MNKDRIVGSAKQVEGSIKEAVGKAVGDAKLQIDGKAEKVAGKAQNLVGALKDAAKP
ncbi:CsbD family protein [Zavarzinia sp.]|uniref:CsbD family protein n=1 Tax=Zavarzinia sp. TaxID=2027920 RepID=UPI00356322C4